MIIGVDGNEANVDKHVGVSVYTLQLLKYFAKHADQNRQFTVFLRDNPKNFMPKENKYYSYDVVPAKILWSQLFLPYHLLFRNDIGLFFAPAHYSPRFLRQKLVVTIHDLSYFYYPDEFLKKDLYKLTRWTKYSVKKASRIIAVSKTTKKDIIANFDIDEDTVKVVYNGFTENKELSKGKEILSKYNLEEKKYFLYVGTIQPRKNIQTLIDAFVKFADKNRDFKLVLVGKKGWLYKDLFQYCESTNLKDNIIFTGFETDSNLFKLYKQAFSLILPSFYEGFGIPILEAMASNCPVIASHASSLPEIGADAALYFDPKDYEDLHNKMSDLYTNKTLRPKLVSAGKHRIKDFSWEKCARETLELLINTAL